MSTLGCEPGLRKPGNSYPCRILIKTTGGVRIVSLKPLAALSEEQFQALAKQAAFEFVNNCYLPRHRLFEELDWPIEQLIEQPGLHYIRVRAAGLPPGEQVDLIGRNGEQLGRFVVNRFGMLLVTTLSQQQEGQGTALRLRRSAGQVGPAALPGRMLSHSHQQSQQMHTLISHLEPGIPLDGGHGAHAAGSGMLGKICPPDALGSAEEMISMFERRSALQAASMEGLEQYEESERGVILRQTMLEERGTIRLRSYFRALVGSGERLFAVTEGLVEAYDLSDAHMPTLAGAWQAEGVLGAVVFGEKLLLWGEPGIWVAEDGPPARRNGALHSMCSRPGARRGRRQRPAIRSSRRRTVGL